MAWLILLVLIALIACALWALKVRGGMLTAAGAALMLGASGYALQGAPDSPSAPARGTSADRPMPLTDARHAFFGDFGPGESWLRISEALARNGNTQDAAGILQNAVRRSPGDAQLWVGLGNALVDHARTVTPAAEFAYRRADQLAPGNGAGRFFYGLALARSGNPHAAVAIWRQVLATSPKDVSWRPLIEQGVEALSTSAPRQGNQAATGS